MFDYNKLLKDGRKVELSIRPIRGKNWTTYEGVYVERRINTPKGYYKYDVRSSDNGEKYATLEKNVCVNFEGSMIFSKPINFDEFKAGSDIIKLQSARVQYIFKD